MYLLFLQVRISDFNIKPFHTQINPTCRILPSNVDNPIIVKIDMAWRQEI